MENGNQVIERLRVKPDKTSLAKQCDAEEDSSDGPNWGKRAHAPNDLKLSDASGRKDMNGENASVPGSKTDDARSVRCSAWLGARRGELECCPLWFIFSEAVIEWKGFKEVRDLESELKAISESKSD